MKKRKPPILLGAMLLVLLSAGAILNAGGDPSKVFGGARDDHGHDEKPKFDPKRELATKAAVLDGAIRSVDVATTPGADTSYVHGEPLLIFPKPKIYKPKPSEIETTKMWYADETMKEPPGGD